MLPSPDSPDPTKTPTFASSPARLRELVALCLEEVDERGSDGLESFCGRYPSDADQIRRRVGKLLNAGLVSIERAALESVPQELGDFRLLERLGQGGMGIVYRAKQKSLRREVAPMTRACCIATSSRPT